MRHSLKREVAFTQQRKQELCRMCSPCLFFNESLFSKCRRAITSAYLGDSKGQASGDLLSFNVSEPRHPYQYPDNSLQPKTVRCPRVQRQSVILIHASLFPSSHFSPGRSEVNTRDGLCAHTSTQQEWAERVRKSSGECRQWHAVRASPVLMSSVPGIHEWSYLFSILIWLFRTRVRRYELYELYWLHTHALFGQVSVCLQNLFLVQVEQAEMNISVVVLSLFHRWPVLGTLCSLAAFWEGSASIVHPACVVNAAQCLSPG